MTGRRVFIHVGFPKTASTFLQHVVFPRLSGYTLVSRPYTQENAAFNALQYADDTLYDPVSVEREVERITADAPENGLLLSDENFCGLSVYNFINRTVVARRLAQAFPQAEILLYLRGQADLADSLHNQLVKAGWYARPADHRYITIPGAGLDWPAYRDGDRGWKLARRPINHQALMNRQNFMYSRLIDFYSGLFSRVHLFLYEDLVHQPASVFDRLEELLGAVVPEEVRRVGTPVVNPRAGDRWTEFRMIHNRLVYLSPRLRGRFGQGLARLISRLLMPGRASAGRAYLDRVFDCDEIRRDNEQVEMRHAPGLHRYPEAYRLPR